MLCLVCGDGSQRRPLERLVATLDLHDDVRFLGERRQVADVLAALDVFILPSRHEGLGVAALEAMGFGLPVVASRVGGLPEVIEDGVTGLLVPPDRPEDLAEAIDALIGDPEKAHDMGRRARDRILERFTLDRMTDAYEALYAELSGFRRKENSLGSGGDVAWKRTSIFS